MVSLSFQVNEMKVSLPFHVFFFIGVITFSMPVATIAQQNSGTLETRANVVEDASTLWMEAKAAAEQDASSDTNKILWFGAIRIKFYAVQVLLLSPLAVRLVDALDAV